MCIKYKLYYSKPKQRATHLEQRYETLDKELYGADSVANHIRGLVVGRTAQINAVHLQKGIETTLTKR